MTFAKFENKGNQDEYEPFFGVYGSAAGSSSPGAVSPRPFAVITVQKSSRRHLSIGAAIKGLQHATEANRWCRAIVFHGGMEKETLAILNDTVVVAGAVVDADNQELHDRRMQNPCECIRPRI